MSNSIFVKDGTAQGVAKQLKTLQKPIITCCRSGARSERAKDLLLENDIDVINGGPWQNVESYLS